MHIPLVSEPGDEVTLLATLEEVGIPPRAVNALRQINVRLVGQLVQVTEAQLMRMPGLGRRTVVEIRGTLAKYRLQLGSSISGWDVRAATAERKRLGATVRRHVSKGVSSVGGAASTTLEDELQAILLSVEDGRNVELLDKRWGFSGYEPATLEAIGGELRITRERVRQVESKARKRIMQRWFDTPRLDACLRLVTEAAPDTAENLSDALARAGLTHRPFSIRGLVKAAEVLERPCGIVMEDLANTEFVDRLSGQPRMKVVLAELRKSTQANGCVNAERLALQAGARLDDAGRVRRLLSLSPEIVWLDPTLSWAMSSYPARNRLINAINKVLTVAPRLHVSELRSAVSKPHRISYAPPRSVLLAFCHATGCATVDQDQVSRPKGFAPRELGWVEETFVRAFQELGSPAAREDLEEFCGDRNGMNLYTFWVYLSYSPLVLRLSPGVFSLVGAEFRLGAVEEVRTRQRGAVVASDFGWTDEGHLWCSVRLDRLALQTGSRALPSFVTQLTQGRWEGTFRDGVMAGRLIVSDAALTDLRAPFAMAGAEAGDIMRVTFELAARIVYLEVGGQELVGRHAEPADGVDYDGEDFEEAD